MSKISINKKNLFLLCLSLMCAVEKVSAMNEGGENQNAEIVEKTWLNLPERALKGASESIYNVGKGAWDNMPSSESIYNVGKYATDSIYNAGKYATDSIYNAGKYAWSNMFANPRENEVSYGRENEGSYGRGYIDSYGEKRELRPEARKYYNLKDYGKFRVN